MRYLFLLFVTICFVSCEKETDKPDTSPVASASFTNVSYGTDPKQVMDIYLPENRSAGTTKTMVIIHGGGWAGGDKLEMAPVVEAFKKMIPEYAFINLSYRLAVNNSVNVFPAQENDVKSAIEFYLSKTNEYKVSKDIIVLGGSAGAHLAMLHSYKNDPGKHVKAVVDFFGPADLVAAWNDGLLDQLILFGAIGKTYDQDSQIYIQSSPINFITSQSPPTIALQGGQDIVVLPSQSDLLISKLNSKGVPNQLVVYPADGHGFSNENNIDAYTKIKAFLEKYAK